jgi:TonB family protein
MQTSRALLRRLWCCLTLLSLPAGAQPARPNPDASGAPPAPALAPPAPDAPAASQQGTVAQPEVVVPPRLIGEAIVEYPEGASGASDVVLELVIGATGEVLEARVVDGEEPFTAAALARARAWRFEPAQIAGKPRAARIRFLISFVPPLEPEPSAPAVAPAPPPPGAPGAARPPPAPEKPIEVTVRGDREEPRATTLTRAEVRQLPGAFGDPFRAIEAMPGVTPIVSGVPFFYVRGAPPGNVGYFLDGIRLPLLYHVGLGPSVVHPAMVSHVDLYPGAYPTRYSRFSGGIVAGEVERPLDRFHGEWQIRLYDSGAMAEAPFADGRGHVLVGGRYSYTAYLISLLQKEARLEYWDYQLRTSYRFTETDALSVFAFGSFDYFGEDTDAADDDVFSTEFHRIDLRHDHDFSGQTRLRSAFTWGFDRTRVAENAGTALDHRLQLRSELSSRLAPWLRLSAGADISTDAYSIESDIDDEPEFAAPDPAPAPTPAAPSSATDARPSPSTSGEVPPPGERPELDDGADFDDEEELERLFPSRRDWTAGAYVDLDMNLARFVHLVPGLRFDVYASKNAVAYSLEPRIFAEFRVTENLTLKNALGIAAQPPSFVVPFAGFEIGGLPGGLQRSVQSSADAEYRLPDAMKLSLSLFHNAFFNMTDILSLARVEDAREELRLDTRVRGQAYGMEIMLHRDLTRRLGGFLAYTLSRSQRFTSYGRIAASFDRTHVLNAVLAYDLGRRWRAGGRLVFYTGNPEFTLEERGGLRLPAFHRLDVRIEKRWPIGTSGAFWALVLEVLNTTLATEVVARTCNEFVGISAPGEPPQTPTRSCSNEEIGPITIPSIALEGRF